MRRADFLRLTTTLLAGPVLLPADPLTQHDREYAMSALHASRKLFLDAVTGLTGAQWKFKASPERWSIAEAAEHIGLSEEAIFGQIIERGMKTPPKPGQQSALPKEKDESIGRMLTNREVKVQAPEMLRPTNRWPDVNSLTGDFRRNRDRAIAYVRDTQEDLRGHFLLHPVFGEIDCYQWILLLAGHTERHTLQINEVKASPGYPASQATQPRA